MSTFEKQISQRKKIAGFGERLDILEQEIDSLKAAMFGTKEQPGGLQGGLHQLAMAANSSLNQIGQQNGENREMLDAVIQLVGVTEVQGVIEQNRLAAMKDAVEKTKANIDKAVVEGKLVKTDKIVEKTLIVGRETKEDGTELPPGMAFVQIEQVKEAFRAKLLGQGVGFKMETEAKGQFEVLDLYQPVPEKPATPVAAEAPPPPAEAAAPAPAPAEG